MVSSLAFIVFYAGEATLTDNTIRLPLINLQLGNTNALIVFAWGLLLWFFLRYWNNNRFAFWDEFRQEMHGKQYPKHWSVFFKQKVIESAPKDRQEQYQKRYKSIKYEFLTYTNWPTFSVYLLDQNNVQYHCAKIRITKKMFVAGYVPKLLRQLIIGNAFAHYLLPYIAFLGATTAPIWSL